MYLPYDVFNLIIHYADMLTTLHLYNVDQTIRKLCCSPYMTALLEYRRTEFFNPYATSTLLDDFLNDLTLKDDVFKREIQLLFGQLLTKNRQFIMLVDKRNGKSTFVNLIRMVMGHRFLRGNIDECDLFKEADVVNITGAINIGRLKSLIAKDEFLTRYGRYRPDHHIIVDMNDLNNPNETIFRRGSAIRFRTRYSQRGSDKTDKKPIDYELFSKLKDRHVLGAFLNFLLLGLKNEG